MAEEKTSAPTELNRKLASTPESTWFKRFLFIPTLGFLVLMTIFPLIYSLGVSFFNYTTGGQAITDVGRARLEQEIQQIVDSIRFE